MKKPLQTNAELASEQYIYAQVVHSNPAAVTTVDETLLALSGALKLNRWNAIVALRDYTQFLLAVIQDQKAADVRSVIERLEERLQPRGTA